MMSGYGSGSWWMMLMPLLWIAVVVAVIWAVVRLIRPSNGGRAHPHQPTPLEILDRRYAQGEIDESAYTTARAHLAG